MFTRNTGMAIYQRAEYSNASKHELYPFFIPDLSAVNRDNDAESSRNTAE